MRYNNIDNALFIENREKLKKYLKPNSIVVLNSNDILHTSADGRLSFIQDSDIFYFSGIDQEESTLVLYPDSNEEKHKEILFVRQTNKDIARWEGYRYSKDEAADISGIKTIYWNSEFNKIFKNLIFEAEYVYLNLNEHDRADFNIETSHDRFIKWCINKYPLHKYERLAPVIHELRIQKSSIEIDLIIKSCKITEKSFRRLLNFVRPGVWEFEIEAEIYHEFLRNRSRCPAFEPIIASGANTCVLHYIKNDQQLKDGDLLLLDYGAEYANYKSDMTRTIPVNGKYTKRQKQIYNSVLNVQKKAIQMLFPGNNFKRYNQEIAKIMEEELIKLRLLNPIDVKKQNKNSPLYKKYFMHSISHYIGLDVHDVGSKYKIFKPGMIFSCEPGIYIQEESTGIRIENDILITENGPVDLMKDIPVQAEEIEDLMN